MLLVRSFSGLPISASVTRGSSNSKTASAFGALLPFTAEAGASIVSAWRGGCVDDPFVKKEQNKNRNKQKVRLQTKKFENIKQTERKQEKESKEYNV